MTNSKTTLLYARVTEKQLVLEDIISQVADEMKCYQGRKIGYLDSVSSVEYESGTVHVDSN